MYNKSISGNTVNNMAINKSPGRPLKFKSVAELQEKIDKYFASCWEQKIDMFGNPIFLKDRRGKKTNTKVMIQARPYTISGLAVALGTSRDVLLDYEENVGKTSKAEFSNTIKAAKDVCQQYAEDYLFTGKNPTGAMFNLKNNYGRWLDKTQTDLTTGGEKIIPLLGGITRDAIPNNDSNKETGEPSEEN